tara:strand:+ start:659 stop:904 length:246 start_codon:yes stop_codon:yes gene_type:complete
MSEENKEENIMLELMKELVEKVKGLENTVYNQSNMLMKSGVVMRDSPTPALQGPNELPDMNDIQKMSWKDIDKLVQGLGGN